MRSPRIFIIYQNAELALAEALKHLFETWGYNAFYCRQARRDGHSYRTELRNQLIAADVVVLLLSRDFQWSPYCQAEAGTVMALNKPFVPIVVSPATKNEVVTSIAAVLEGSQFLSVKDDYFIDTLKDMLTTALSKSRRRAERVALRLQQHYARACSPPRTNDYEVEARNRADVKEALQRIVDSYQRDRPIKRLMPTWSSLADNDCKQSIIGNITRSLETQGGATSLAFVGVSLKYSLDLITTALNRLKASKGEALNSSLNITLVHMDDQSHVLHALGDTRDIDLIRRNFGTGWVALCNTWKECCDSRGVAWKDPNVFRIDYIPPRVGILINDNILYAGRCAFTPVGARGNPVYNLDVGELEYQFFAKHLHPHPQLAEKAIDEFISFLAAYKHQYNNNGVAAAWESSSWLDRINQCLNDYHGTDDIAFISSSCTKFQSMVLHLLDTMNRRGYKDCARVIVYVHDGGSAPWKAALEKSIVENLGELPPDTHFLIKTYKHAPTFRAAVIGKSALAIQPYIATDSTVATKAKKLSTGLIFTRCFAHFDKLRGELLSFADGEEDAVA